MKDWILWKLRTPIARMIVWYLRSVAGAFHCFPYGPQGRYVVLMKDYEAGRFNAAQDEWAIDERIKREVKNFVEQIDSPQGGNKGGEA